MLFTCQKIHPCAIIPTKIDGNLAFDLHVVHDSSFYNHHYPGQQDDRRYVFNARTRRLFNTGLKIAIPEGYGVILKDRSGLAAKRGIHVLAGVIDSSYRGEWKVCLLNTTDFRYEIIEGDRIAQAVIVKDYKNIIFEECQSLDDTFRGTEGFGSSGR